MAPLKKNGILHADSATKAEILNKQFSSVFTQEDLDHIPAPSGNSFPSITNIEISAAGVAKLLQNIKPNKASGPDNIPCRLLKELASEIAPCLSLIFQQSLDTGQLPQDWKKAQIAPAFKKGNSYQAENYRPISLTCVCCKIMEHNICHHIHKHIEKHNIITRL